MFCEDDKVLTQRMIDDWDLRDSSGRLHRPTGLLTSTADVYLFLAYDDYPEIGGRIHCISMETIRNYLRTRSNRGDKPITSSRDGVAVGNTGAGFLVRPADLGSQAVPFTSDNLEAEEVIEERLKAVDSRYLRATMPEQKKMGIDFVVFDPGRSRLLRPYMQGLPKIELQVKMRQPYQRWPEIFLQISETNPEGHFSSRPIKVNGAVPC